MTGTEGEVVFTEDTSSGRIHKRIRVGDKLASLEQDNLDDAGGYEIVTATAIDTAEPDDLCRNCFPPVKQDGQTG